MTHYIEIDVPFSTAQAKMDQISERIVELGLGLESQFRSNPDNPNAIAFKGFSKT